MKILPMARITITLEREAGDAATIVKMVDESRGRVICDPIYVGSQAPKFTIEVLADGNWSVEIA